MIVNSSSAYRNVTPIEVLEDLQEIGVVGLIKSPGLLLTLLKFFPDFRRER